MRYLLPIMLVLMFVPTVRADNVTVAIAASTDDVMRRSSGDFYAVNVSCVMGSDGTYTFKDGLRFLAIAVANSSTIDSAFVDVFAYDGYWGNDNCNVRIYGEDTSDATTFSNTVDYDARLLTTANVAWGPIDSFAAFGKYTSPDIKTIVQEIVDRGDWSSGNDMVILLWDNASTSGARRDFCTFDLGNSDYYATIRIYFTPPATGIDPATIAAKKKKLSLLEE